jgi:hypothetical protein
MEKHDPPTPSGRAWRMRLTIKCFSIDYLSELPTKWGFFIDFE